MELCSMIRASLDGRGFVGRMDTCVCMPGSLCCPSEIITFLIGYTPIQNKMRVCSFHHDFKGTCNQYHSLIATFHVSFLVTSTFLKVVLLLNSRLPTFWAPLLQQSSYPPTSVTHAHYHIPNIITTNPTTSRISDASVPLSDPHLLSF